SRYVFNTELRRSVIFGRHDVVQHAPISRLDLLVCRNTIMYFNAETQTRVLSRFHFALNDKGFLFLGRAELLLTHANLFSAVELKYRLFSKVPGTNGRNGPPPVAHVGADQDRRVAGDTRAIDFAMDTAPWPRLVIDQNGVLVLANHQARALFGLLPTDVGRP